MIRELNNYILNPKKNENFGNWKRYIDLIDPFRDNLGSERIGNYIYNLHTGFKNKLSVKNNILNSNNVINFIRKNYLIKHFKIFYLQVNWRGT